VPSCLAVGPRRCCSVEVLGNGSVLPCIGSHPASAPIYFPTAAESICLLSTAKQSAGSGIPKNSP
jgi:hypothetical protein